LVKPENEKNVKRIKDVRISFSSNVRNVSNVWINYYMDAP